MPNQSDGISKTIEQTIIRKRKTRSRKRTGRKKMKYTGGPLSVVAGLAYKRGNT